MNITETIADKNYLVSIDMIEELSRQHAIARNTMDSTGSTYLAILIAGLQYNMHTSKLTELEELDLLHKTYYAAVLAGIESTGDKDARSKGTFARTAASTLRSFLKLGGDLEAITAGFTSKAELRRMVAPEPEDRSQRIIQRSSKTLISTLTKMAKDDVKAAKLEILSLITALHAQLDNLEPDPRIVSTQLTRTAENRVN